ncbi:hypothetical protein SAICODRAFT_24548 [Saitoella complicata NRRL Y-17804]|uniref:Kinetochore protein SPC25 n=1 Tax=Saitoella complicata (strain BCRC 22490 / CBS 7301 / JCM 7358 / NBRC 10748 / NRRL Y-17804) TaxID=698492 RepID=A0A0E9NFF2_SAICN|nr:uncharacterized protein SAICODRAFT_24548 [Saitoella complicata NRRL Y-17804]ODQ54256.1 hypothetical protein SAICODRAFT_24548 [Saitoella complicata NRRL Y-17804]GAO48592.1 hypothetical protein G7K_2764-t1 [Saitoella complicata NRRL Y-17804]
MSIAMETKGLGVSHALPMVESPFAELKAKMAKFTLRFDAFVASGREKILRERTEFAKGIAEDRETHKNRTKQLEHYKTKQEEAHSAIEKERLEKAEVESSIAQFSTKERSMRDSLTLFQRQIADTESAISKRRAILAAERERLAKQKNKDEPEVAFFEEQLGLRIDRLTRRGEDHIRIVFNAVNERDPEREYWVLLDLSKQDYEVSDSHPNIPPQDMDRYVALLNETRNLRMFLVKVRGWFKRYAAANP